MKASNVLYLNREDLKPECLNVFYSEIRASHFRDEVIQTLYDYDLVIFSPDPLTAHIIKTKFEVIYNNGVFIDSKWLLEHIATRVSDLNELIDSLDEDERTKDDFDHRLNELMATENQIIRNLARLR